MPSAMGVTRIDSAIDPTACVHPEAVLGSRVSVGPYACISRGAVIGCGTHVGPHAVIGGTVTMGKNNRVAAGVCLGVAVGAAATATETGPVIIGDSNIIREFVCITAGSVAKRATILGNDNFIMAGCHLGAGCAIGSHVVLANGSAVGLEAAIGDGVNISGLVRIEDSVRIGRLSMVGGVSHVDRDIPPFTIVTGHPAVPRCLNYIGLMRCGLTVLDQGESFRQLKRAWFDFRRHGAGAFKKGATFHGGQSSGLAEEFRAFFNNEHPLPGR
jgi:UDP-N-acetylglucosamine acyltransferase